MSSILGKAVGKAHAGRRQGGAVSPALGSCMIRAEDCKTLAMQSSREGKKRQGLHPVFVRLMRLSRLSFAVD